MPSPRKIALSKESREFYDTIVGYLRINPDELEADMSRHSVTYAFLAASQADAKLEQERAKMYFDTVKASAYLLAKSLTYTNGAGKDVAYSDEMAKAHIYGDAEVVSAKARLIEAEYRLSLWDGIITVIDHRSYMLTKLADLRYADRKLETEVFNGQTKESVSGSMNSMANMEAKRQANLKRRQAQLESVKKGAKDGNAGRSQED